jgi:outer membrane protein assembly factor BamB
MSEHDGHTPSSTEDWSDGEPQPHADPQLPYVEQPSPSTQSSPLTEKAQRAAAPQLGNGLRDERTLLIEDQEKRSAPRIHWTARVSCGISTCAILVFALEILSYLFSTEALMLSPLWYLFPFLAFLYYYHPSIDFLLRSSFLLAFSGLVFFLSSLIFAGMALALSFKPHWRKGRGIAIVGALLLLLSTCSPSSNAIIERLFSTRSLFLRHPLWTYTFDSEYPYKMTVANGIAYTTVSTDTASTGSRYSLVAVQNGKRLWRYQTPDQNQFISGIQVDGGVVYLAVRTSVSASADAISAINARTGQELWHSESKYDIQQLIYAHPLLYFSTQREVHALDAQTGKLQWSYQFSDGSRFSPFSPALAVEAESLYISLATSPYQAGNDLIALNGRTGRVQWEQAEIGGVSSTSLVVDSGVIYRRVHSWSQADRVSAFNAKTGKALWETSVSSPGSEDADDMKVAHNLLYLYGAGHIQAYAVSTGHLIWSTELEGKTLSLGPIVGNGVVYVGTETPATAWVPFFDPSFRTREWLYALNAQSGKLVRILQDGDTSFKPVGLVVDNQHLYLCESWAVGSDGAAYGKQGLYVLGI